MKLARATIDGVVTSGEVEGDSFYPLTGDVFTSPRRRGDVTALKDVALLAPIAARQVYLIIGGFVPEAGAKLALGEEPWLTPKIVTDVSGDNGRIAVPAFVTGDLWMEVEVALVIQTQLYRAAPAEARDGILGFTVFNDATAAQFQEYAIGDRTIMNFFRAKSIESFAAMGPWIDTNLTERDLADGLGIRGFRNGELAAQGNTALAKFPPSQLVSFVSQSVVLYPGDVISMGTPQAFTALPGDTVSFEVDRIGSFTNHVVVQE
jgi:2-keto-4-pentenoate hydratase/2-oxohepta-3-ene-1,7-dioic acid hydratase in catechol pathway